METKYVVDGTAFRIAMFNAGYKSISALAEKAELSRGTVTAIADGTAKPDAKTITKLATCLNLDGEQIGTIFFKKELA